MTKSEGTVEGLYLLSLYRKLSKNEKAERHSFNTFKLTHFTFIFVGIFLYVCLLQSVC